jgi:hypothetical protein
LSFVARERSETGLASGNGTELRRRQPLQTPSDIGWGARIRTWV